ncbi:MAG: hypothetical protein JXB88_08340 [Spirochaetales bacterium]|nr:hypothetical protein [Spirochaetales bacterium]
MAGSQNNNDPGFTDIEERIKSGMYRFDCPSPLELGEYQLNLFTHISKQEIEDHIKSCPYCCEELRYMKEYIKTPVKNDKTDFQEDTPPVIIPYHYEVIYHDKDVPSRAVRGEGTGDENRKITIKLDKNRLLVMYYTMNREEHHYVIHCQFVPDIRMEKKIIGALIEIWQDNKIQTTALVDDLCAFLFKLKKLTPVIIRISHKQGTLLSMKLDV